MYPLEQDAENFFETPHLQNTNLPRFAEDAAHQLLADATVLWWRELGASLDPQLA